MFRIRNLAHPKKKKKEQEILHNRLGYGVYTTSSNLLIYEI